MTTLNEFHKQNVARQHEAFAPPHLTNADVLDAVADCMTYLSLIAADVGCDDLEKLLGDTFNMVSERAGSAIKTTLGQP